MSREVCFFSKCHGSSKWKSYGVAAKETVTYSKLLGQKKRLQHFIELNDMQISKSGKKASYCIIDKMYSLSKRNNIDIFIFDEESHGALYLEYAVHEECIIENCNDLITFLNFNKNSTFDVHSSFIYVKSADGCKWTLFFNILELLIKNLNMSVIGSQFYFPLFSKYLIMNEFQLLQNCLQTVNTKFFKTYSQTCEIFTLRLKKVFSSAVSHSKGKLQNPKNNTCKQIGRKIKNLTTDLCKSIQKLQLKRKSIDACLEDDCLPKSKRFNSNKVCHCKNDSWKIFTSFKTDNILSYTNILKAEKWTKDREAIESFPVDCEFQTMNMQYSKYFTLDQNEINHLSLALNSYKKSSQEHLFNKASELSIHAKCSEKTQPILEHSDLSTVKSVLDNRKCSVLNEFDNCLLSAIDCRNEESFPKILIPDESHKIIASSSGDMPQKTDFDRLNKHSLTFQTASGKSLKISEAAFQAAEKMFKCVSSEDLDIFSQKKTQNIAQQTSTSNKKLCVGFQTASGISLHASKVALEVAEKMFKDVEKDVSPEKQAQTKQNSKECYPSVLECEDEDINALAENFFEDIPFDEKDLDSKPTNDFGALSVQKQRTYKTTHTNKIRKSLGGRRSLKPYTLKN